jgi:hypothetical protein
MGSKSTYQTHDSDSGGEKSQRSARGKQSYHNGDDVSSQQSRENNRGGNERHHDKQHFQKQSAQQGNFSLPQRIPKKYIIKFFLVMSCIQ